MDNITVQAFLDNLGDPPAPELTPAEDITLMQMEDMEEKLKELKEEAEKFPVGEKNDKVYRRLSELCVKYSISLDRINVMGREEQRDKRKKMLIEIDAISNTLVEEYEKWKKRK